MNARALLACLLALSPLAAADRPNILLIVADDLGWSDVVAEMNVQPSDMRIMKRQWGAFYGTELDLQLRRRGIRTIVQWPYKLNLCLRTPIELFNLEEDPDEWTNVAEEPRYAEIVQKLRGELEAATPDPERYDELRYQNEERRLALLAAIPENERPRWRDDWHDTYRETYGKDPIPKS